MSSNLKHFENYFKNRQEVIEYFKNTTFIFDYMTDNVVYYVNTIPEPLGDYYVNYVLGFYYELGESLFLHEVIEGFNRFQLSEVKIIPEIVNQEVTMYFRKYVNPSDN